MVNPPAVKTGHARVLVLLIDWLLVERLVMWVLELRLHVALSTTALCCVQACRISAYAL